MRGVFGSLMEEPMQPQTLDSRVERLEKRMDALENLPARMDALDQQILQFRAEVRAEFSALRGEIREGDEETRRVLRDEIRETGDKVLNQGRVLYEDMRAQFALIQEGLPQRRHRPPE